MVFCYEQRSLCHAKDICGSVGRASGPVDACARGNSITYVDRPDQRIREQRVVELQALHILLPTLPLQLRRAREESCRQRRRMECLRRDRGRIQMDSCPSS